VEEQAGLNCPTRMPGTAGVPGRDAAQDIAFRNLGDANPTGLGGDFDGDAKDGLAALAAFETWRPR
jgi:hypothetical protein